MDYSRLLAILVSSSVIVTGFQPNYSPGKFSYITVQYINIREILMTPLSIEYVFIQ
jgi:hypothetical protein